MLALLTVALLYQSPSTVQPQDGVVLNEKSAGEGLWETEVHKSDLEGQPTWNPDLSDAPAVSQAQAIRAAQKVMATMALNKTWPDRWSLGAVELVPTRDRDDVWVYVVNFIEGHPPCIIPPGYSGCGGSWPEPRMRIVVLPNGHAITPTPAKRR